MSTNYSQKHPDLSGVYKQPDGFDSRSPLYKQSSPKKPQTDVFSREMQESQLASKIMNNQSMPGGIKKSIGSPSGLSPELGGGQSLNLSVDMLNTVYLNKKYPISKDIVCLKEGALPGEFIPKTAYEKLMIPGIFIKQKVELFEILAGCEMENKYKIYSCDYQGNQIGASLFESRESSNICSRWCLSGDCRPFTLYILHNSDGVLSNDGQLFMKIERVCKFTCLCFQRPEIKIYVQAYDSEMKANWEYLGRVLHDFQCCAIQMKIYNAADQHIFTIKGDLYQMGIWTSRRFTCDNCQKAFFFIHDVKDSDKIVGLLERRPRGIISVISDSDNFSLNFPFKATLKERALLLATSFFFDYRFFEHNPNNGGEMGTNDIIGGLF